jgi:transcriptional regulator with XRE-family HTH domain
MSKISKNIRHLRQDKGWSQEQLAEKLTITRARIGSYEEDRCSPPIETLVSISNLFHISLDALVKADLSKYKGDTFIKIGENRILFPIMVDPENNDVVEVVNGRAQAGYLTGYADPEYIGKLPIMNLPFRISGKHRAFVIRGDSMPPLTDGCYVIGKFVESLRDVRIGRTYVLVTKSEGVVYKRVMAKPDAGLGGVKHGSKNNGEIELHSDNKNYAPFTVSASDVLEIWEFVCTLNISDKKEDELNLDSIMNMLRSMRVEIEGIRKK